MTGPREILIIKLSAIGDVVHALPFLDVLGRRFPEAHIDWIVEDAAYPIVEGHPRLRRILVSHRKHWLTARPWRRGSAGLAAEAVRFVRELRARTYDLVVDLQGLLKSGILAGICRGRRKVGMSGSREGARAFLTERPVPVDYEQHAIERYLQVAEYLGCRVAQWSGRIPLPDGVGAAVEPLIEAESRERPLVAVNPMARWDTKLWDPNGFVEVARRLQEEMQCRVVFTGSGLDRRMLEDLNSRLKRPALNLAGRTTLKELAYLYSRCAVLLTTDTGPMHIAAAMGCPVVALFGPTAPWRTGPYGAGHRVVRVDIECAPCFKKACEHLTCMRSITVDAVVEAVESVLEAGATDSTNRLEGEI
ncbi:MAG: lipopolysaccharide heptosyltransferase II [Deltaproteobacteria bacterium]|nr:MAG: lipopolysaccharide heptosyltransferase II [Deltaproteobacteria bacterium]